MKFICKTSQLSYSKEISDLKSMNLQVLKMCLLGLFNYDVIAYRRVTVPLQTPATFQKFKYNDIEEKDFFGREE